MYFCLAPDPMGPSRFAGLIGTTFYFTVLRQILSSFFGYNKFTAVISTNILAVPFCKFLCNVCTLDPLVART
jgi:hypothetical protein